LTRLKSADSSVSDESPATIKTYNLGRQLVQVARNSLLDADALRYSVYAFVLVFLILDSVA
jgi:hypothetical protein